MNSQVDFDLHGIVGIRLLDATPRDAAVVSRQLGPIQTPLERDPDILIRFVDRLSLARPMRYLDQDDVGFTDDAFVVLRTSYKTRNRAQIPFDQIGRQCEIVCEHGLPSVPLLIHIVNMTALAKGVLPVHASAFNYRGKGIVATGWARGGKTETLLAFMTRGAEYVGDEWVYLTGDGRQMFGIPEPIRVYGWHLDYLPQYRRLLRRADRTRLRMLKLLSDALNRLDHSGAVRRLSAVSMLTRMLPLLRKQMHVEWAPLSLFGQSSCPLVGVPERFFMIASYNAPDVTIELIDPQEIIERMVHSMQQEQLKFMSYYFKFRYAFPRAENDLIERSERLQRKMLAQILSGKKVYAVYHPYPVPIQSLFEAIRPYCD
jgi:hypothetical protein